MKTAAELKILYDQAYEAMGGNPDTADPDLARAFHSIRAAMIRQDRREQGFPEPPPPIPKSERRISVYQAVDDLPPAQQDPWGRQAAGHPGRAHCARSVPALRPPPPGLHPSSGGP
jgi:hypothetical protein